MTARVARPRLFLLQTAAIEIEAAGAFLRSVFEFLFDLCNLGGIVCRCEVKTMCHCLAASDKQCVRLQVE